MSADSAHDLVARAEAAHKAAVDDVATAHARIEHTRARFDSDRSDLLRAAVVAAEQDAESADRILARSRAELERARHRVAEVEGEQRRAKLAQQEAELSTWQTDIDAAAAKLAAHDVAVCMDVTELARRTRRMAATYEQASLLAHEIGQSVRFRFLHALPTIGEARLRVLRMLTSSRLEAGRPPLAAVWLANASLADAPFNSVELESIRPHVAAARAAEATAAILHNAANPQPEQAK